MDLSLSIIDGAGVEEEDGTGVDVTIVVGSRMEIRSSNFMAVLLYYDNGR
jgi:hypothetical protein